MAASGTGRRQWMCAAVRARAPLRIGWVSLAAAALWCGLCRDGLADGGVPSAAACAPDMFGLGGSPLVLGGLVLSAMTALAVLSLRVLRRTVLDLAASRRAGGALAQAHAIQGFELARYRHLADHASDMIVETDLDTRRHFVSPASLPILGFQPEDLIGTRSIDVVHPEDVEQYAALIDELRAGRHERIMSTQRCRRRDGTYVWVEETIQLTRDPASGQPCGFVGSLRDVTHRREAERAVRDSEAFLRSVIANSADAIMVLDLRGRLLFMSRNGLSLMGFGHENDILGRPFVELCAASSKCEIEGALAAATLGASAHVAASCGMADGSAKYLAVQFTPMLGGDGRPERIIAVSRDVTSIRKAEAALREKTALLETTLAAMDQGLIMVDAEGRVPVANRRAIELLQLSPDVMERPPSYRMIREQQRLRWGELVEGSQYWMLSDDHRSEDVRCERRSAAGDVLEIRTVPLPDGGVVQTFTDITHLKRAETAVRDSEARYRLLAENASDIIILETPQGARSYVSPAVEAVLGYRLEDFLPLTPAAIVHPEDLAHVRAATGGLGAACPKTTSVHRLRHRSGHWVWVEATYTAVTAESGHAASVIAVVRDVTERQRQAEELRNAKGMAELAQARAELANQAKSEFLAAMSHEIRTPLNSIIGFTDLLAEAGTLEVEQQRQVALISSASSALLTVINDILDFSKIEAGAVELDRHPFDLRALIDNCASMIEGVATAKSLAIVTDVEPGLPESLVGDEARLRQVLLNLLNNAVKFTSFGSVTLTVRRKSQGPSGETLRIAVTDTGPGIPKAKQNRLFQRFSQIDGSVSRNFGGTGLGLAISRRLVGLMGGKIGVDSDAGQGATFWFTVTLPKATGLGPAIASGQSPASPKRRSGRLLLVEDVDVNQELAKAVLESAGYEVDVAGDGEDAVSAVATNSYDLVLMDVQMPGMDGMTATRQIRAFDGAARTIPIIAMTANVYPEQIRQFRQAGMNDHIAKPFKRAELYAVIDRCLPPGGGRAGTIDPMPTGTAAERDGAEDGTSLLGPERTASLLDRLNEQLRDAVAGDMEQPEDRTRCQRDAHGLASAAGLVGFGEFAALCGRLETSDPTSGSFVPCLERLREARAGTLSEISRLGGALRIDEAPPLRRAG